MPGCSMTEYLWNHAQMPIVLFCLLKCFKFINKKNVLNRKQSSCSRARRSWVRIPVSAKDFFFMKSLTVKVYFYDNHVLEFVPYKSGHRPRALK